jgi:phosphoserine phosphatase
MASVEAARGPHMSVEEAKRRFKDAQAVCFDVDSTVITGEWLDSFAEFLGVGDAVAELTKA